MFLVTRNSQVVVQKASTHIVDGGTEDQMGELLVLDRFEEGNIHEQSKKKRKKRHSKYIRDYRMDRKQLLELFGRQYVSVNWSFFGTLSFNRQDIPLWMAHRSFDAWKREIQLDQEDFKLRWVRVTEYRTAGQNLRFHVFFRRSEMMSKYPLMARWKNFVSGEADLWYGFTGRKVDQYLKNVALQTSKFEIKEENDW
jgi:hypothetical protein